MLLHHVSFGAFVSSFSIASSKSSTQDIVRRGFLAFLKSAIGQEKTNRKSEESGSGNPENTREKKFVLVREFFCSRTKTKKFSDHVLRSYTRQNLRTKKRAR
ncbi:hypothetical protein CS543_10290 [Porphyromonas gingivalis]|nr:hypothetical protein CS374_02470 [Porphyromonas gingivalis]ATS11166.1 hypothetical protein CS543_10290 [Porphyromonas gingivalis]